MHIVAAFSGTRSDTLSKQSLHALQQIYGYMTFNDNKFGILTNWQRALFLRRAETSDRKTLEYYLVELDGPISMLKLWVGMVSLAENDWSYASPTISSAPPDQTFGTSARKAAVGNAEEYHAPPEEDIREVRRNGTKVYRLIRASGGCQFIAVIRVD